MPTYLPQLASEGRAPNLEGKVSVSTGCGLVDVGTVAPLRLAAGFAASFYGNAPVLPPLVLQDLPLISTGSRIR